MSIELSAISFQERRHHTRHYGHSRFSLSGYFVRIGSLSVYKVNVVWRSVTRLTADS